MLHEVALVVEVPVVDILARMVHFAVPGHGVNISRPIKSVLPLHVLFPISKMREKSGGALCILRICKRTVQCHDRREHYVAVRCYILPRISTEALHTSISSSLDLVIPVVRNR
jgi:hypothetical protein